jgi:hypothetical protein
VRIEAGPWQVEADPEATARAHDRMPSGSPERCGCRDCLNFAAARTLAYPPEALELFARLGIRPDRESEIGGSIPIAEGRFLYSGWFHFVGRLLNQPAERPCDGEVGDQGSGVVRELHHHALTPQFGILLWSERHLVPAEFGRDVVVQLDFTTELPWVLPEPPKVAQE